jgi:hypothetical protein
MQRTAEGRFETTVPVAAEGAYWVAVRVEGPDGLLASGSSGVVASYADEFAFRDPDVALAAALADGTGGRVDPAPDAVYEAAPLRGNAESPLWPWLVAAALVLFLLDVALRRLVFAREDLTVWRQAVTPQKKTPVAAIETPRPPTSERPDTPVPPTPPREVHPEEETLSTLLRRKRRNRQP